MKIEVKRDKESLVALGWHLGIMKKLYRLYWIVRLSIIIGLLLLPVSLNISSELISGICFVLALILLVAIPILYNRRKHYYLAATNGFTDALIKIIEEGNEAISNAYIETDNDKLLISSNSVRVSCPPTKIKKTIKQNIEGKNFLFVYFADKILTIPENGLPDNVSLDEINTIMHQKISFLNKNFYLKKLTFPNVCLFIFNTLMLVSLLILINQLAEFFYSLDYIVKFPKSKCGEYMPFFYLYDILNHIKNSQFPLILIVISSPLILFYKIKYAIITIICEFLLVMTILFIIASMVIIHYMGVIVVI